MQELKNMKNLTDEFLKEADKFIGKRKEYEFINALCQKNFSPGVALNNLRGGEPEEIEKPEKNNYSKKMTGRELNEAFLNSYCIEEFEKYFAEKQEARMWWFELSNK